MKKILALWLLLAGLASAAAPLTWQTNAMLIRTVMASANTNFLYMEYSVDGSNFFSLPNNGAAVFTNTFDTGVVLRDPSWRFDTTENCFYVVFTHKFTSGVTYVTKYFGIIKSYDLLNWRPAGNGLVQVIDTNAAVWAPEWFDDGSDHWVLYSLNGAETWRTRALNQLCTAWSSPERLTANTGLPFANDAFCLKSAGIYWLSVSDSATATIYTNGTFTTTNWKSSTAADMADGVEGTCIIPWGAGFRIFWDTGADITGVEYKDIAALTDITGAGFAGNRLWSWYHTNWCHSTILPAVGLPQTYALNAAKFGYGQDKTVFSTGPTITSGIGVPTTIEPNGSLYLRLNGALYLRTNNVWTVK